MNKISFSKNWNNKLSCDVFTTIRQDLPYLRVNELFIIDDKSNTVKAFKATIIKKVLCEIGKIPDYTAYLDTAHDSEYVKKLLFKLYKDLSDSSKVAILLLKRSDS
jgi:hypothetical protein